MNLPYHYPALTKPNLKLFTDGEELELYLLHVAHCCFLGINTPAV